MDGGRVRGEGRVKEIEEIGRGNKRRGERDGGRKMKKEGEKGD